MNSGDALVRPSRRMLSLFAIYLRWYIGRHFHALRLVHAARFPSSPSGPLIVCVNHPSWWDPLTCLMVSRVLMPSAEHYAPMDAASLRHYSILHGLGLFPVEQGTTRGAAQFLYGAQQTLALPASVLWMTPQGAFTDVRKEPVAFKGGLGALLQRLPSAILVPLAVEYTFWDERLPEALTNCGFPVQFENVTAAAANAQAEAALAETQRELAALAMTRDASQFQTIVDGGGGLNGIYGGWKSLRTRLRGQRYNSEHGSIEREL